MRNNVKNKMLYFEDTFSERDRRGKVCICHRENCNSIVPHLGLKGSDSVNPDEGAADGMDAILRTSLTTRE